MIASSLDKVARENLRDLTWLWKRLRGRSADAARMVVNEVTLRNEFGETIQVRRDGKRILVRHSDVDPVEFGVLKDMETSPPVAASQSSDVEGTESGPAFRRLKARFGPWVFFEHQRIALSKEEDVLIRGAASRLG